MRRRWQPQRGRLDRHTVLRTRYPDTDDGPVQEILPVADTAPLLTAVEVSETTLANRIAEMIGTGFDVTTSAPVRGRLFSVSPTDHVLVMVIHHISADGFRMGPLTRDVMTVHVAFGRRCPGRGHRCRSSTSTTRCGSGDPRRRERPRVHARAAARLLVEPPAGARNCSSCRRTGRAPARASMRGAEYEFALDANQADLLDKVAREHNSTIFMVMHAAFAARCPS